MKHVDLFSGIGGFALAARWMNWTTAQFVEIDPFCQKVLTKNFPNVPIHGDIKTFNGTKYRGTVDILTGGFPCQPYSIAGKRRGDQDDRHLWPEMRRVIGEVQPPIVVGENVYGLLNWSRGMVFEQVQTDLANIGYEVTPFVLPACGVNAPHRRDRVWFIANATSKRLRETGPSVDRSTQRTDWKGSEWPPSDSDNVLHPRGLDNRRDRVQEKGSEGTNELERETPNRERVRVESFTSGEIITNNNKGLQRSSEAGNVAFQESRAGKFPARLLRTDWKDFPTQSPLCGGNDGIPNRVDRIKSLGNAIVPQVAFEIFKAISMISET